MQVRSFGRAIVFTRINEVQQCRSPLHANRACGVRAIPKHPCMFQNRQRG